MSYDQIERLPESKVGEILAGQVVVSPRPAPPHAHAASAIGSALFGPFDRPPGDPKGLGGWWILDEPELRLHGDVLVPDLAGWRRERMPSLPAAAAFDLAPDWVCEVISPATASFDRTRKLPIYARERVGHLWIVDPLVRTLEVFALGGDAWTLLHVFGEDADRIRAEPFEALDIELRRWWA